MHPDLDGASAHVTAPSTPDGTAKRFVVRKASMQATATAVSGFQGLAFAPSSDRTLKGRHGIGPGATPKFRKAQGSIGPEPAAQPDSNSGAPIPAKRSRPISPRVGGPEQMRQLSAPPVASRAGRASRRAVGGSPGDGRLAVNSARAEKVLRPRSWTSAGAIPAGQPPATCPDGPAGVFCFGHKTLQRDRGVAPPDRRDTTVALWTWKEKNAARRPASRSARAANGRNACPT